MKAKDTVMKSHDRYMALFRPALEAQAEISFKAGEDKGKQEGFDKVVEFVDEYRLVRLANEDVYRAWQGFKERGK